MDKKIIETSELPLGEKVYLKKDFLGWRVVHPIKNEDGTINYFNLICGSKSNLVFLLLLLLLATGFYFGVNELISNYKTIADKPCDYCVDCINFCNKEVINPEINFSNLNITIKT